MSYKTITLKDGSEFACNKESEGLFTRKKDGTWQQLQGTSQTPRFRDAQHLSRYVHEAYREQNGERLARMTANSGW